MSQTNFKRKSFDLTITLNLNRYIVVVLCFVVELLYFKKLINQLNSSYISGRYVINSQSTSGSYIEIKATTLKCCIQNILPELKRSI